MRSVNQLINLVIDGEIRTKEQAAAIIQEESELRAAKYGGEPASFREGLLEVIGHWSRYLSNSWADTLLELYDTQHPIFGRTHPEAKEALRMEEEFYARRRTGEAIKPPVAS